MTESRPIVSVPELSLHLAGGSARDCRRLDRAFGRRDRWWRASTDAWCRVGLTRARAARLAELRDGTLARHELERAQAIGARIVAHRDRDYPERVRHVHRPPLVLYVRGRWPLPATNLAIVGSRAATAYGTETAARFASAAVGARAGVVSGLARGVDRAALEGALDAGGWPIAVLGCGVDVVYPVEHRALQARIAECGTLVSEFPIGRRPDRFAFPRRNRILAALSTAVLVVEAAARSGALITASHALELGLDVLAVPGRIDAPQSTGTNRLIADGATPALEPADALDALGLPGAAAGEVLRAPDDPLLARLALGGAHADALALDLGLPIREIRARLTALALEGAVTEHAGGVFALRVRSRG